jgi:hypothetical protein
LILVQVNCEVLLWLGESDIGLLSVDGGESLSVFDVSLVITDDLVAGLVVSADR